MIWQACDTLPSSSTSSKQQLVCLSHVSADVAREFHLYLQVCASIKLSDELEPVGRLGVVHVKTPVVFATDVLRFPETPVHLNHAREYAQLQPGAKLRRRHAGRRLE